MRKQSNKHIFVDHLILLSFNVKHVINYVGFCKNIRSVPRKGISIRLMPDR